MVTNKKQHLFLKPYPVTGIKNQLFIGAVIGLFISFILIVFQPFGTYNFKIKNKFLFLFGYGIICTAVYSAYYSLLMILFKKWFLPQKWTVLKEIVTLIPILLIIPIVSLYYYNLVLENYTIEINHFLSFFLVSFAIGIVPFSAIYYYKWLKNKLTKIQFSNGQTDYTITINSNNKKEEPIHIKSEELIYIKSSSNYIEVFTKNNATSRLIRNSLNYVEGKLPEHDFLKIHRSYIVNIKAIDSLKISNSTYFIKVKNNDIYLPVSRSVIKTVKKIIK